MNKFLTLILLLSFTLLIGKSGKDKATKQWDYYKVKVKHDISTAITKNVQQQLKNYNKPDKTAKIFRVERKLWEKENEKIIKFIARRLPKGVPAKNFDLMVTAHNEWQKRSLDFYKSYKTELNGNGKKVKVAKFRLDLAKNKFDYYLRFIKNNINKKKKFKPKKIMKKSSK